MKSDNGGEFAGAFKASLQRFGVKEFKSRPGMPNDNAKIERLWRTLANHTKLGGWQILDRVVRAYNEVLPHSGINGMVPKQLFDAPKWQEGEPAIVRILAPNNEMKDIMF